MYLDTDTTLKVSKILDTFFAVYGSVWYVCLSSLSVWYVTYFWPHNVVYQSSHSILTNVMKNCQ